MEKIKKRTPEYTPMSRFPVSAIMGFIKGQIS
jgi:hypothetical protein